MIERAVVIGAGFGGLAAAIRLRAMGYQVTVVDAQDQPGGRARAFRKDGYVFDAGPTVITAPYLLDELFTLVGRDRQDAFELVPVDPFYRVRFPGGGHFDYVGEEERLLAQIERIDPRDVDGYRRFAAHAQKIFDVGYTQLASSPFDHLSEMLRVVPSMIQLESYRSVYGLAAKYFHSEELRQVFSFQPLLVGGNPFTTTSIYALIHWLERKWGVWFAKGGTTAIVAALVGLLDELGVPVRTRSKVTRVLTKDGRACGIELEDGSRLDAELVVSDGDPAMIHRLVDAPGREANKSARMSSSMSLFVSYFGTKRRYDDVKHHTIVLGPRYRGLLEDIFKNKVLAKDFSLYLHRPTATDPSLAPAGHDAWYVLSPVPNLQSQVDWAEQAGPYQEAIFQALEETMLPGLKGELTTRSSIDPRHFLADYHTKNGAAFGPEPVLTQSAWFRNHNRSSDVPGLFFVGAGAHPGAGVPGVLCSAKVMERVVPRPKQALPLPKPRGALPRAA